MSETLSQALADERGDVAVLRAKGLTREAEMAERIIERIARAAEPFTDWLSETEAALRSGHAAEWHRARFADLEGQGLARRIGRSRQYLRCSVPQRANLSAARDAGERGERIAS